MELCTKCHEDTEKMKRHGHDSIMAYRQTYHWIQVKYGLEKAPNCVNCHIQAGYSSHGMLPKTDPRSAIHSANKVSTCQNQRGVQTCHPAATEQFVVGREHGVGMKKVVGIKSAFDYWSDRAKSRELEVIKVAKGDITQNELFQGSVLAFIRILYQLLIAGTIGFMALHQVLDYIRSRKEHRKAH
ncbi:MAG: hypothetical protein GY846_18155 [Deltaproteobacteria bacterium]|nr:hypothetical protein [Deltaproteobacteria bacterium]